MVCPCVKTSMLLVHFVCRKLQDNTTKTNSITSTIRDGQNIQTHYTMSGTVRITGLRAYGLSFADMFWSFPITNVSSSKLNPAPNQTPPPKIEKMEYVLAAAKLWLVSEPTLFSTIWQSSTQTTRTFFCEAGTDILECRIEIHRESLCIGARLSFFRSELHKLKSR